jgi:hypothetical protein
MNIELLLAKLSQLDSEKAYIRFGKEYIAPETLSENFVISLLGETSPSLLARIFELFSCLVRESRYQIQKVAIKNILDSSTKPKLKAEMVLLLGKLGCDLSKEQWNILGDLRKSNDILIKTSATWTWCELGRYEQLGLIKIPAGNFIMGSNLLSEREKPKHTSWLPTFYIAKYPVTYSQWEEYVNETGNVMKYQLGPDAHNCPALVGNFGAVYPYAQWKGMTIPSEAEWEKAARGEDGQIYPWGNTWKKDICDAATKDSSRTWTNVDQYSPNDESPYGCSHMIGNSGDLTRTLTVSNYPYNPYDGRENISEKGNTPRVFRGGWSGLSETYLHAAIRGGYGFEYWEGMRGFRMAVTPLLFHHYEIPIVSLR